MFDILQADTRFVENDVTEDIIEQEVLKRFWPQQNSIYSPRWELIWVRIGFSASWVWEQN